MEKKCWCGKQAPLFAQLHGWVKDDIDMWYCPDHKSGAYKSKKEIGQNSCNYCKTPFQTIQGGFYSGSTGSGIGDSILHMKKGCDSCGVPVCFNCAAGEADKRGMNGHCICPGCGSNLDS